MTAKTQKSLTKKAFDALIKKASQPVKKPPKESGSKAS